MFYYNRIVYCSKPSQIKQKKYPIIRRPKFPLNYTKDPVDDRDFKLSSNLKKLRLPYVVDHSSSMSSVKDQGHLGSCAAFAVTALKEWQEQKEQEQEISEGKKDQRKGREYNYSESWVYWNAKKIDPWPDQEGTSLRYVMKVLNKLGVPTENAWPYNDTDIGKPKRWAPMIAKWAWISSYWRISNLQELKIALQTSPVPIGVACFREIFYVGTDGIVPYPANPNDIYGGHAVCATGYDQEKKLIKFKNSWGKNWGQNGYGYFSYDYIDSFLWDAWLCKDIRVTREMLKETRKLVN